MRIGVPKEIKSNENRIACTPAGVVQLLANGHEVFVETSGGLGSGFTDEMYKEAGATIVDTAKEAWSCDMVMKVKEPLPPEFEFFTEGLILFTYLHLAPEIELTKALMDKKVVSIAYETVELPDGSLPLLTPMSEVAGRMSTQVGVQYLTKFYGGKGKLLGGVPGVAPAKVTVIGGGISGTHAAQMAVGLGADVTILDISPKRLRELSELFGNEARIVMSNTFNIEKHVAESDLLIGAVLIPGKKAPTLVTEEMVKSMEPGSVIVDIAIDQGGSIETIGGKVTTHADPVFEKHGITHYSVANMPGAVPQTSTYALTNVTLPYAVQIANKGYKQACLDDPGLLLGINTLEGHCTYKAVADDQGLSYVDPASIL